MTELITLSKRDPRFLSYLDGTFSKLQRALPLESLNVNTDSEQVTFRLIPVLGIKKPFWGFHWLQILKVRNFVLMGFPVFLILLKNEIHHQIGDPLTAGLSALGALCLMTALNLRNDYIDHLSGLDRVHPQSGSRAIQKGWVTAREVLKWSYFYMVLGFFLGLRALILYNEVLILLAIFAGLGILGITSYKMGFKYRKWSEWTTFWLLGPFLTLGIQLSTGAGFNFESLFLGIITGWIAVFYIHLKNFEQLLVNGQAQFQNTMTWLGFEKGKQFLALWWILFFIIQTSYHHFYSPLLWRLIFTLVTALMTFPFVIQLNALKSSVGSGSRDLYQQGRKMIYVVIGLWLLQQLWYL